MSYRLRLANTNDFNNLIGFYRREHSERLPAPSPRAIGQAIEKSQLLVVSDADGIAATAGTFDVTPPSAKDFVGELAGTRVTKVLGGTQPIRKQCILIVMRVLSFVLPRIEVLDQATSDTLIVIIRKGNVKSQTNILACGFQPLDARPDWLLYDEISWNGKISFDEWDYFYATEETARQCARLYIGAGMQRDVLELFAADRLIELQIELPGLRYYQDDLHHVASGQRRIRLGRPPEQLVLLGSGWSIPER